MKTSYFMLTALAAVTILSSCEPEKPNPVGPGVASGYLTGIQAQSSGEDADYLLTTSDLMSGTITATGVGVEQEGWMYYHKSATGKYLAFDYTNLVCTGYTLNNGTITESGNFVFPNRADVITNLPNNKTLIIGAPWGGGSYDTKIQTIDPASMTLTQNLSHPLYEMYDDTLARLNMWPTHTFVDGDKLYVSYYPLNGSAWTTDRTDTAYVTVFSYPDFNYLTTFKDTRTGPIGYYGGSPCVLTDENGNHFTLSTSSLAAGFTQATKPSGILKINSGATAFDASYFFNIEALGYKLLTGTYVGNGKAVVRVVPVANDLTMWGAFSSDNPICRIAVVDLYSQTFTIVNDVPLHGGQYFTPFLVEDAKVYVSVNNGTETYVYRVDAAAATAVKGAKVEGDQLKCFFKF